MPVMKIRRSGILVETRRVSIQKNDDLLGNTETHCAQATVFLILQAVFFVLRNASSLKVSARTALRRLLPFSVLSRHLHQNKSSFSSCAAS